MKLAIAQVLILKVHRTRIRSSLDLHREEIFDARSCGYSAWVAFQVARICIRSASVSSGNSAMHRLGCATMPASSDS